MLHSLVYRGSGPFVSPIHPNAVGQPLANEPCMGLHIIQIAFRICAHFFHFWQFNLTKYIQESRFFCIFSNQYFCGFLWLKNFFIFWKIWEDFGNKKNTWVFGYLALFWQELINRGFFCNGQLSSAWLQESFQSALMSEQGYF